MRGEAGKQSSKTEAKALASKASGISGDLTSAMLVDAQRIIFN